VEGVDLVVGDKNRNGLEVRTTLKNGRAENGKMSKMWIKIISGYYAKTAKNKVIQEI
jgi:hypothetical protein